MGKFGHEIWHIKFELYRELCNIKKIKLIFFSHQTSVACSLFEVWDYQTYSASECIYTLYT